MRTRKAPPKVSPVWVMAACLVSCQSPHSFANGAEYLESKGFGSSSFAQVRIGGTTKNINDELPGILGALRESEMIPERYITPVLTIYIESGSSLPSQTVSIGIGEDGYGVIQHSKKKAFIHCAKLPAVARAAFNNSTIVLR